MSDVTQPRMARGTLLPAGILAAALIAMLAFAPFASAASDPVASGTTTVTLNSGFAKALKKGGVKVLQISPATVKGKTVTLPVSGGAIDPLTGLGTLTHSGGIKLKAGKKSVALKSLELNTSSSSLTAKIGSKALKVATLAGFSFARDGFGVDVDASKLKLTGKAAKELNKALAPAKKKTKGKKGKGKASNSKKKATTSQPVFKANQVLGGSSSSSQPSTLTVLPGGKASLATNKETVEKLAALMVKIETVAPTVETAPLPPAFAFPVSGGTISPAATAGIVQTSGGLKLVQNLGPAGESKMSLNAIYVDLGAKTATVEVVVESTVDPKLNLGVLGRSSIADINLTGATIAADPASRTVSVSNATATLQAVTAEVLNSVFGTPLKASTVRGGERPRHVLVHRPNGIAGARTASKRAVGGPPSALPGGLAGGLRAPFVCLEAGRGATRRRRRGARCRSGRWSGAGRRSSSIVGSHWSSSRARPMSGRRCCGSSTGSAS